MAQEIIVEIYSALETVEEINNFPAWVWSIARYTFYKWLGKQKKNASIEIIGPIAYEEDVIKKAIQKDELNRLRREISFLSERYREIIILHYFENKSCKEIAELLSIPPGTVKWYLYDARKKIKWGMEKMRIFGEGSYRPGYLNFGIQGQWGKDNNPRKLAERMIPQNILLKAYEEPVSIEELSELLGIARPYMEEEMNIISFDELPRRKDGGRWLGIGTERVDLPLERIPLLEKRNVQRLEKLGYNGPWIDNKDNWGKWWLGTVRHGFVNVYKILERVYTEVKKIFNKLYEELASVIREGMPKFLERETDNYIFALIFDLVPLTFEYALDRQIITKPESEAPYLTFYIWYKK